LILGGSGNNRGALLGSLVLLGLLEGSRFAKDVIPFLAGVRLAAAQQILVGGVLVAMMIRRPEGLLPEKPGADCGGGARRRPSRGWARPAEARLQIEESAMRVGFIGLGNMGGRMAGFVRRAGYSLVVHDLRRSAAAGVLERGALWADSPRDVAAQCDVVS